MATSTHTPVSSKSPGFDILYFLRQKIDGIPISNAQIAHLICQLIPSHCPFERDVILFGQKIFHIPPLCQLNPLYQEFVYLRFRALNYLADICGDDITQYIS
jgi:Mo-dependent nitrogenase C-terminus